MPLSHQYDVAIRRARMRAQYDRLLGDRPYADDLPHAFPDRVTDTERWEWPLVCERNGRVWEPAYDPGRAVFFADPLLAHGDDQPMHVEPSATRVVVCATRAELSELYAGQEPGERLHAIAKNHRIGYPAFNACTELAAFWPTFFGSRWYVDPMGRTSPRLLIATGNMRNHSRLGGETVRVGDRLGEIAARHGTRLVFIEA